VRPALAIRDEVGFFQEVRAVLAKSINEGGEKSVPIKRSLPIADKIIFYAAGVLRKWGGVNSLVSSLNGWRHLSIIAR